MHIPQRVSGGQMITWGSQFSPFTMWIQASRLYLSLCRTQLRDWDRKEGKFQARLGYMNEALLQNTKQNKKPHTELSLSSGSADNVEVGIGLEPEPESTIPEDLSSKFLCKSAGTNQQMWGAEALKVGIKLWHRCLTELKNQECIYSGSPMDEFQTTLRVLHLKNMLTPGMALAI